MHASIHVWTYNSFPALASSCSCVLYLLCLGKTRMETPVHSPQQQCRLPSPPKAAKRHLASNKYKMNELKHVPLQIWAG
ncbi:hypothetical protein MKW92_004152 [Papaver armeniacum]|nr:hypothetical protein MKW92_004152 [Papaver armeniacum]